MSQTTANISLTTLWNIASTLHLLQITDSSADAGTILHVLQHAGFHCRSKLIKTRAEFLDCLSRFPCDIVLADYRLRGWTGMEAFSTLRQSGREAPFILVTEALGEEVAVECIKQGVTDYVLKDHLSRLPVVVARALDEKAMRDARNFMVEALRQSEANSLLLFAHNPLPMWVLERENLQIIQINDAAIGHYGYDRVEFLRMRLSDFHPPKRSPGSWRNFSRRGWKSSKRATGTTA